MMSGFTEYFPAETEEELVTSSTVENVVLSNSDPWEIISETFEPFTDGRASGISLNAVCKQGSRETEYSCSRYFGQGYYGDEEVNALETEDDLKQRLRDELLVEINDPNRAELISHRF